MRQIIVLMGLFVCLFDHPSYCQVNHRYELVPLETKRLQVSTTKMTSLIFPAAIKAGVKITRDLAVQKVKGLDNVLQVRAIRAGFAPTNVNVYCVDGKQYAFDVTYTDSAVNFNYSVVNDSVLQDHLPALQFVSPVPVQITGLPVDQETLRRDADSLARRRGFLHKKVVIESMRLRLKGLYVTDKLLWFALQVKNFSDVPYHPDYLQFFIVDRKKARRRAIQQVPVLPVYESVPDEITHKTVFTVGVPLFTISKKKKAVLEISEVNGGRLFRLELSQKVLLRAKSTTTSY